MPGYGPGINQSWSFILAPGARAQAREQVGGWALGPQAAAVKHIL